MGLRNGVLGRKNIYEYINYENNLKNWFCKMKHN